MLHFYEAPRLYPLLYVINQSKDHARLLGRYNAVHLAGVVLIIIH